MRLEYIKDGPCYELAISSNVDKNYTIEQNSQINMSTTSTNTTTTNNSNNKNKNIYNYDDKNIINSSLSFQCAPDIQYHHTNTKYDEYDIQQRFTSDDIPVYKFMQTINTNNDIESIIYHSLYISIRRQIYNIYEYYNKYMEIYSKDVQDIDQIHLYNNINTTNDTNSTEDILQDIENTICSSPTFQEIHVNNNIKFFPAIPPTPRQTPLNRKYTYLRSEFYMSPHHENILLPYSTDNTINQKNFNRQVYNNKKNTVPINIYTSISMITLYKLYVRKYIHNDSDNDNENYNENDDIDIDTEPIKLPLLEINSSTTINPLLQLHILYQSIITIYTIVYINNDKLYAIPLKISTILCTKLQYIINNICSYDTTNGNVLPWYITSPIILLLLISWRTISCNTTTDNYDIDLEANIIQFLTIDCNININLQNITQSVLYKYITLLSQFLSHPPTLQPIIYIITIIFLLIYVVQALIQYPTVFPSLLCAIPNVFTTTNSLSMIVNYTWTVIMEQSIVTPNTRSYIYTLDTTINTLLHQILQVHSSIISSYTPAKVSHLLSPDTDTSVSSPSIYKVDNDKKHTSLIDTDTKVLTTFSDKNFTVTASAAVTTATTTTTATNTIDIPQNRRKKYVCKVCSKTFSQRGGLHIHNRIHLGQRPYKCTLCDKAFSQACNLKRHLRSHTGERPFQCDICLKHFNRKFSLIKHRQVQHGI